jgi:hypothetical protein
MDIDLGTGAAIVALLIAVGFGIYLFAAHRCHDCKKHIYVWQPKKAALRGPAIVWVHDWPHVCARVSSPVRATSTG